MDSMQEMKRVREAQRYGTGLDGVVPEEMFQAMENHGIQFGGQYQYAAEHIGDLVHRLSFTEDVGGGMNYGIEASINKASQFIRPGAFDDCLSQVRRNHQYFVEKRGYVGSEHNFIADFKKAAARYAAAYRQIEPYTEFQAIARNAAILLGELRFEEVQAVLADLVIRLTSKDVEKNYWRPVEKESEITPPA